MILDLHTHRPAPYPEGIISLPYPFDGMEAGQLYSVGIHPWATADENGGDITEETWRILEETARRPEVAAIGECGVDLLKGGPLFRQLLVFKRQVEIAERVGKPMVLHCVKATDIILGLKRDLQSRQQWAIHGFRGKPAQARQLTDKEILLSFGEKFNAETLRETPDGMILAETDESILTIEEIIGGMNEAAGRDLTEAIRNNTAEFLRS